MSLNVWLKSPGVQQISGPHIFIREDGGTREISREEWDQRFPDREPVVVECQSDDQTVFDYNITHNLNTMAREAGIYLALWRPGELLDPVIAGKIGEQFRAKNYHGPGGAYELEQTLPTPRAHDLIEPLRAGLALLVSDPERFKKFNPENGWGDYDGLVRFVREYLEACEQWPDAEVHVSR